MKKRVFFAAAIVLAAALTGGVTAWGVSTWLSPSQDASAIATGYDARRSVDELASDDARFSAGTHFTAYTEGSYPDLTYAAENAVKAVVSVIKTEEIPQRAFGGFNDPFLDFFGIPRNPESQGGQPRYREQTSGGSGVIISPDGYIVTNHHVVENAARLTVKLPEGKTYDAKLIGTDADTEIALLKIEETGLPSLPFGNSDALRLGEWVLAIGNPFDLHSTVTAGIVSAKGRSLGAIRTSGNSGIESFIQTDAAVNPGNSGGALVNTKGELVGINTLIKSPTGAYAGYAFAVPEAIVRKVVSDLREYGVVQRALLGIEYVVVDEAFLKERGEESGIDEVGGLYVANSVEGGAAEAAGIRKGDVITEIDGQKVDSRATVAEIIGRRRPGDTMKIVAKRDGKVKQFDVVLRNRAGKSELVERNTFDAIESLGGEFAEIRLSDKQKKELDIKGGIQVTSIARDGILARANVQRGYIITQINGRAIGSVNDLYRITEKITSIEGVYPNGKSVTYSLVE